MQFSSDLHQAMFCEARQHVRYARGELVNVQVTQTLNALVQTQSLRLPEFQRAV